MRFTGQFVGTTLDLDAYRIQLDRCLKAELQCLIKIWLGATTGRVPVWSGMARGSLLSLAEMVGGRVVISPKVRSRIPEGRSLGSAKYIGPYLIEFTSSVPHYTYLEKQAGYSPTSPWLSFSAGAAAFKSSAKNVVVPPVTFKPVVKSV
jgi:hypothetical protein